MKFINRKAVTLHELFRQAIELEGANLPNEHIENLIDELIRKMLL